jgi:hypothetical protein
VAEDERIGILDADMLATLVFLVVQVVAIFTTDSARLVSAIYSCALFAVGIVAFLWAYALGVSRSRHEVVTLPALFFLADSAPRSIASRFRLVLAVQVLVAVVAASVRPFTNLAYGILVPMFGLGMMALWGGRCGRFPPRK